jgi:hypothetical protein
VVAAFLAMPMSLMLAVPSVGTGVVFVSSIYGVQQHTPFLSGSIVLNDFNGLMVPSVGIDYSCSIRIYSICIRVYSIQ